MFSSKKQVTPLASFSSSGFHVPVAESAHLLFLRGKIVCGITTTESYNMKICLGVNLNPDRGLETSWMSPIVITKTQHLGSLTDNSWILWWDPDHDWQQSQQVNQVYRRFCFSYLAGSAWRHSAFVIQDEKGPIFISDHEGQDERPCRIAFQQIQAYVPIEHALPFLRLENFLPGSDGKHTQQPLACSVSARSTDI